MGTTGQPRRISAHPTTYGSDRRPHGNERLDPVRWRRPGRGTLLRLATVAALLATAAAVSWCRPQSCTPGTGSSAADTRPAARVDAAAGGQASDGRTGTANGSHPTVRGDGTGSGSAAERAARQARSTSAAGSHGSTDAGGPSAGWGMGGSAVGGASAESSTQGGTAADRSAAVPSNTVGVPIRLADPAALALVHPGNRVDLFRFDDNGTATVIAGAALVLDVTRTDDPTTGGLLLALSPAQARRAVVPSRQGYAIVIQPT